MNAMWGGHAVRAADAAPVPSVHHRASRSCVTFIVCALLSCIAIVAPAQGAAPRTEAVVPLGRASTLAPLFGYQPGGHDTLAGTIRHYLEQSTRRDRLAGVTIEVEAANGLYHARISTNAPLPLEYVARLERFLTIGREGARTARRLQREGMWDTARWRFFAPAGLPLATQRSVQLMHFPPDSSLAARDYLATRTSRRWEALLRHNGVRAADVTLYEAIVDILPIAAPAADGDRLAPLVPAFRDYARHMLTFAARAAGSRPRPIVAYGHPVRRWVEEEFHVTVPVLGLATIGFHGGTTTTVLGANHPSFIWYAASRSRPLALKVMKQDLIAACWQARMAADGRRSAPRVLRQCAQHWDARPRAVCVLTEMQGFNQTPTQARATCAAPAAKLLADTRAISDEETARMEREVALDRRGR